MDGMERAAHFDLTVPATWGPARTAATAAACQPASLPARAARAARGPEQGRPRETSWESWESRRAGEQTPVLQGGKRRFDGFKHRTNREQPSA